MCELLGITSNIATDVAFSFSGLALRGGQTGPHADGWGISLYDGRFARTFLEPHPAFSSPLARFVRENPIHTRLAVAHVRKMTRGSASIENTHPFVRVFDRRHIVFAHNGTLPNVREIPLTLESPIGDTDSEHAFCVILERLRAAYGARYPEDPRRLGRTLFELGNELGTDGVFNFLLADGEHLFARCGDSLTSIQRRAPFGLATLVDADVTVNLNDAMKGAGAGADIDVAGETRAGARLAVVATLPLTRDEPWEKAAPGDLWVFAGGDRLASFSARTSAA
jgi:predicted glutamine amidotransferase